jgi:hypothetical protein
MGSFAAMERRIQAGIIAKLGNADVAISGLGFRAVGVFMPNRPDALDGMVQANNDMIQISQLDMTTAALLHIEAGGQILIDGVIHNVRALPYLVDGFWEFPVKAAS